MNIDYAKFIGDESEFSVEHRILNLILLFGVIIALISGLFNYLLDLGTPVIAISLVSNVFVLFCYYLSRFRKIYTLTAVLVIIFAGFVITPLMWITNGGIDGGATFYIFIFGSITAALLKGFRKVVMVICLGIMALALMLLEYKGLIPVTGYASHYAHFIDVTFSMVLTMVANITLFVVILNFFRREEEKARNYLTKIEKQQLAIEMARLDRLNLVGEMAASIGHEVRNPLTTVRGFLQYFQGKNQFQAYRSQFSLMIEELDRANSIITEYLSLAKNKKIDLETIDLNSVIIGLYPLIQASALQEGKQVQIDLDYPATISADRNEIRQCLLNLIRNGMEASGKDGVVIISTRITTDSVLLSVKDTGQGIPPEILDKLGTPFLTTKENGAGLGLAVCYKIIERHNAKVEVATGEAGTTFVINFARIAPPPESQEDGQVTPQP